MSNVKVSLQILRYGRGRALEMIVPWEWFELTQDSIGQRIRTLRTSDNLSLTDVGLLMNKSSHAVQHWEVGDSLPTVAELVKLAQALGGNPVWLVTGIHGFAEEEFLATEAKARF